MGIHFSHILGIVWINASHEISKRPIALQCLYFPIHFPYYENSVFSCSWNCMGFYDMRNREVENMEETQTFGIFAFSHNFPNLRKFSRAKYGTNTSLCNICIFP